jgi:hypothetical protein
LQVWSGAHFLIFGLFVLQKGHLHSLAFFIVLLPTLKFFFAIVLNILTSKIFSSLIRFASGAIWCIWVDGLNGYL